jgi:mediator of RNA polymerase II transcription subunit 4
MASDEPLKSVLHAKLNEFSSLTRMLLELINNADKPTFASFNTSTPAAVNAKTNESDQSTTSVLDKLIERDREIQEIVETAIQMKNRQRDIDWMESQLEICKNDIEDFQNRLYDVEKLLELTVHHGKQKLDSIEQSQKGSVSPEKLISYAHKISQASTAISPVGWQPNDPRRPFPQDIEMRAGVLGRLSYSGTLTEASTGADQGTIGKENITSI